MIWECGSFKKAINYYFGISPFYICTYQQKVNVLQSTYLLASFLLYWTTSIQLKWITLLGQTANNVRQSWSSCLGSHHVFLCDSKNFHEIPLNLMGLVSNNSFFTKISRASSFIGISDLLLLKWYSIYFSIWFISEYW